MLEWRRRVRARVLLAGVLAPLALGGCVLDRVLDTHRQLCEASPPQVVVAGAPGEGYRIAFAQPTLTRDDVEWLVGLPPTSVAATPGGVRLAYVASPSGRRAAPGESIAAELVFRDVDGVPKLAASVPPARLSALVPRELVDGVIATICRPEISLAPPGARFDISSIAPAALPDEARIVAMLGPPHFRDGASIGYRFCLEPCDPWTRPIAQLVYTLRDDGRLARAEIAYFRYLLVVDPPAGVATISLRLP
jgi:hypothetical protein